MNLNREQAPLSVAEEEDPFALFDKEIDSLLGPPVDSDTEDAEEVDTLFSDFLDSDAKGTFEAFADSPTTRAHGKLISVITLLRIT